MKWRRGKVQGESKSERGRDGVVPLVPAKA